MDNSLDKRARKNSFNVFLMTCQDAQAVSRPTSTFAFTFTSTLYAPVSATITTWVSRGPSGFGARTTTVLKIAQKQQQQPQQNQNTSIGQLFFTVQICIFSSFKNPATANSFLAVNNACLFAYNNGFQTEKPSSHTHTHKYIHHARKCVHNMS